jgi:hypothetical protein
MLFPKLKFLGVVPTMVAQDPNPPKRGNRGNPAPVFTETERTNIERLNAALRPIWGIKNPVISDGRIPERVDFSRYSGTDIAFIQSEEARRVYRRLGELLRKSLGI